MAGNLTIDQIQLGNNADPTRNFVLRTNADGTMTIARGNVGATTQDIMVVNAAGVLTLVPQSMTRLNTANGYGSTNTVIRRFTNVVTDQGTDITYADSATLGATFTINTNGVYAINYNDQFNAASDLGLSLNSTQLTTAITSVSVANILASSSSIATGRAGSCSFVGYLPSGSVVRPHTSAATTGGSPNLCQFTITRVA